MYNLLNQGGTFKGLIGEAMFKLTRNNAYMTRFHSFEFINYRFNDKLSKEQLEFLKENWYSLDVIEISNSGLITLFEVKTQNYLNFKQGYQHKITKNCYYLYSTAKELGFVVKVARVQLMGDWNYRVLIDDLDYVFFNVDRPKKYDKQYRSKLDKKKLGLGYSKT